MREREECGEFNVKEYSHQRDWVLFVLGRSRW